MKPEEKYMMGRWETGCLILNLLVYKLFTNLPSEFAKRGGTAAGLSAILSGAAAFALIFAITEIYKKSGKKNITELAEDKFGKTGKYITALIMLIYLFVSAVYALREFTGLVKFISFPTAPVWFVALFFTAAMIIGISRGMNSIVRTHIAVVPSAVFLTAVVLVSAVVCGDARNLLPVLGNGAASAAAGGVRGIMMYSDIVLLFLLNPFCRSAEETAKIARKITAFSVVINIIFIITLAAVIPYPLSGETEFPVYRLLKMVYYGRFFQRIDAIYMLAVVLSGMLYLSFAVFSVCLVLKQAFGLSKPRAVGAAVVMIIFLSAQISTVPLGAKNMQMFWATAAAVLVLIAAAACGGRMKKQNE